MKFSRLFLLTGLVAATPAWAVYAPIPEQDQGKPVTVTLRGAIAHDSNIFGSATNEIDSMVYSFTPKIAVNVSATDQTFVSGFYNLMIDHFSDRPGDKTVDSHEVFARVAHAFTKVTTLDLSDDYSIQKNPESLLAGLPVNTDQSFKRNEFNARFDTKPTEKVDLTVKFRTEDYSFDSNALAALLDRTETLAGLSGGYAIQPEVKLVAEYRHQKISYDRFGFNKDKTSDFALVGGDYNLGKRLVSSARIGVERRKRTGERNETAPYVELTGKYDYAQGSFLSAGYIYSLEESSNTILYTDTEVNRFFVNVQHAVTSLITVSGTANYEPSKLNGRRFFRDVDETVTRFGLGVSYAATKNWLISGTYDYDHTDSDDASRNLKRNRVGVAAIFAF